MPYHYRFFVDREIVTDEDGISTGGDHVRVIDVEADETGMDAARELAQSQLEAGEVIGSASQITMENPEDPLAVATFMDASGEPARTSLRLGEDSP